MGFKYFIVYKDAKKVDLKLDLINKFEKKLKTVSKKNLIMNLYTMKYILKLK